MCICINCRHVHSCTTYNLIQKQHKKYINSTKPNFIPLNTLIQINIQSSLDLIVLDWDLIECISYVEQPGSWLIEKNSRSDA
uniref:Ycf34 n=1 Tax=Plocamium cartilagineum TaxID=31452 RepID=A0A1C9CHS3_PLOCA|nr:hypothetical protein Plocam_066 [Plocamium cartilagineum]AOM67902.1 hypothetical protein Plocam_066 [Plocamium cartilagineum]